MCRRKTCVFITGTNAVGKTTLVRGLINHFGCIKKVENNVTYCNESKVCFAGKYREDSKFGGVDSINTSILSDVVVTGLYSSDIIFCEGSFMNSFGLNLQKAMFQAKRNIVITLYSSPKTIYSHLFKRNEGNVTSDFEQIMKKQKGAFSAAKKWLSIGVEVFTIDTGKLSIQQELEAVLKIISEK